MVTFSVNRLTSRFSNATSYETGKLSGYLGLPCRRGFLSPCEQQVMTTGEYKLLLLVETMSILHEMDCIMRRRSRLD
jgi:hypothetical protein